MRSRTIFDEGAKVLETLGGLGRGSLGNAGVGLQVQFGRFFLLSTAFFLEMVAGGVFRMVGELER